MTLTRVGLAGAGTMGAGIAEVAALGGFETRIHDPDASALGRGLERIRAQLTKGGQRGLWEKADAEAAATHISPAPALDDLAGCELVIEACPEDLALKRELFATLEEVCDPSAILATNTSSLPVAEIARDLELPERVCGMHFFNPPALMKLVEVVATDRSGEAALGAVEQAARAMGRQPIRCTDSPGFVVNRCNRPFALESLRILEEGLASHDEIDAVIREDGGYRMGPFELMDLIGIDVNLEVARSFHRQRPIARWQPSPIQERMVAEGRLGRKSGRGFYEYGEGAPPRAASPPEQPRRSRILERVVAQLANEASFAAAEGVAAPPDIDRAMRLGLNHPRGPFEWVSELGAGRLVAVIDSLHEATGDERYDVAPLLRDLAA